jgi:diguanylate cyclase (GGDEF)-like protein
MNSLNKSKLLKIYAWIALTGLCLAGTVWLENQRQTQGAWQNHLKGVHAKSKETAADISNSLRSVYENLRTISFLPTVRTLHETSYAIDDDGRSVIQQIYNNLASNIDVSEVYLLQKNFDPTKIDPLTAKPFEPAIMFDELIIDGGKHSTDHDPFASAQMSKLTSEPELEEVEAHEYAQLKQQIDYFSSAYPKENRLKKLDLPMISGDAVITCDNRYFKTTGDDADRSGLIFSLPVYDLNGAFNGMVSGIVLQKAISALLPNDSYSITSPNVQFTTNAAVTGNAKEILDISTQIIPESDGRFFEIIDLATHDPQGYWKLRTEISAADFYTSTEFKAISQFQTFAYAIVALLTAMGFGITYFTNRRAVELKYNATHDALTGLPNSVFIREKLAEALQRTAIGEKFAILYMDLDRFKLVNDTLGHHAGDLLLKAVAKRLKVRIGKDDVLARIGGDEFVLLCHLNGTNDVMDMARGIITILSAPFTLENRQASVGTSIGIALAPADGKDAETLIRNADMALFRAKNEERNTFRFFEPHMDEEIQQRRKLEMDLRNAIATEQFEVYYQPIVSAQSEKIVGFEALVRWNHPQIGLVQPTQFISIAEDIGVIIPLGEWILRKACMDAMTWPEAVRVAVNLSAVQFRSKNLPLIVVSALEKSGLPAHRLELEITESVLISDDETARLALEQIQILGVRIALDDFGTGYSSLSYLRSFKFDKIKIDRSFMKELATSKGKDLEIVKSITTLGRSLGMSTTAEGVETKEQLDMVRTHGCNEVQGYYFSQAVPYKETFALFQTDRQAKRA